MIKLIIFDADGVLIHEERFSSLLEREYGISREVTAPFFNGLFQTCRTGGADLKESIASFLPTWGWDKGVDAFIDLWFNVEHKLDEELVKYIQELRRQGIVCVLGTNQEKYRFEYMLKKLGFENFFDKAYVSAYLGCAKPDSEFFSKILNDFKNINKNEVLLVDDREENVKSAEEYGFHGEFYTTLENLKQKIGNLK